LRRFGFRQHLKHSVGLTPTGRASVRVLQMNAVDRAQLRAMIRIPWSQQ